jgi:hypothetical protein
MAPTIITPNHEVIIVGGKYCILRVGHEELKAQGFALTLVTAW